VQEATLRRQVASQLEIEVRSRTRLMLQIAVADSAPGTVQESLSMSLNGVAVTPVEVAAPHGGRIHTLTAEPGTLLVDYQAVLEGRAAPAPIQVLDEISYLRPSRYAEADRLGPIARAEFAGIPAGPDLLAAVSSWVGTRLFYVSGSSSPTDGAVDTLLQGQGVCRDFAHLVVGLLRALDVPARLAAVYAPGLSPMDFHAVGEALVEGRWQVVDATLLAPRSSLVRIATGRDAADTALATTLSGRLTMPELTITAVAPGDLPYDDHTSLVTLP
jgi:hypothetical protein